MKQNAVIVNLLLWIIAILATLFIVEESGLFKYLGPLYFICMMGSTMVVAKTKK
ncbi:MAG: hypothetical protein ACE5HS_03460 [bacterium]